MADFKKNHVKIVEIISNLFDWDLVKLQKLSIFFIQKLQNGFK